MESDLFQKYFYTEYQQLNETLTSLTKTSDDIDEKLRLTTEYEKLNTRIEILKKYFSDNATFIPGFEVRKAQEHIGLLNRLASDKRDELFPKKKFGFKSKQKMTSLESTIQKSETQNPQVEVKQDTLNFNDSNSCMIKDLNEQNLIKTEDEVYGKDIAIVNCNNCTIQIFGNPSVVHMSNVNACTILCGPLSGTAFINTAVNCKIVIASHQLRIHDSTDTHFFIHTGSRAIIENCKRVHFGPYAWSYGKLEDHFKASKLNLRELGDYNWRCVDDFNWLNQEKQSPNWSFMTESEKIKWTTNQNGELKVQS